MTAAILLHRKFKLAALLAVGAMVVLGAVAPQVAAAADPLKITVYGGSGNIGQRIVKEALDRGHQVTVVTRNPARVTEEKHANLTAAKGDILDTKGVAKQIAGQDVVVIAVSFRGANPDYGGYKRAGESYVAAARPMKNKPRLIVVGGAGSLEVKPGVLLVESIPAAYRGEVMGQKDALDFYRTVKDVPWTYFSPAGTIQPGERTGKFRLGGDQLVADSSGKSVISMEDYAVALIDEAEQPKHTGERFTIGY